MEDNLRRFVLDRASEAVMSEARVRLRLIEVQLPANLEKFLSVLRGFGVALSLDKAFDGQLEFLGFLRRFRHRHGGEVLECGECVRIVDRPKPWLDQLRRGSC